MSVLPIEVKFGKDYTVHSALDNLMAIQDYHIVSSIVLSNEREYPLSPGLLCYVPGEQGAGRREPVLLGLIRIAVYKIILSSMFRLYFNWHIVESVISLYLWVFTKNHGCTYSNILSRKIY